jgi:serine/threonine protein kinase, bacterial
VVTITLLHPRQRTPVKQWHFTAKSAIRIGRSPDNNVVISDILVSRYHLELSNLSQSPGDYRWHMKSRGTNGTFLDGRLASQGFLANGSIVQLGPTGPILKFEFETLSLSTPSMGCNHAGNFPGNLFCVHCGQPLTVLRTIRNYLVLRKLGHGGMGTTFLVCANDTPPGERPQVRVLKEMNADLALSRKARELFEREARTLQSLSHPGIPRFFEYFIEGNKQYLVMELIQGEDLDKWVIGQGPVPYDQAVSWMLQTCDVLDYIHSQDPPLIHRDLKPSNLLLRSTDNRIVLIDFGVVKVASTSTGTRIAVEGYSSPEQSVGHPTVQSDLYGVGATLVFLITGQSPIKFYRDRGEGHRIQVQDIPNIPEGLRYLLQKATEPLAVNRYLSALDLAQDLQDCLVETAP